jgi:hypothetical protein
VSHDEPLANIDGRDSAFGGTGVFAAGASANRLRFCTARFVDYVRIFVVSA